MAASEVVSTIIQQDLTIQQCMTCWISCISWVQAEVLS